MTRIISYNILAGGYSLREQGARRSKQIIKLIKPIDPDIVGLVEAIHPQMQKQPLVVEEIAAALGMQMIKGGKALRVQDYQLALLTRLPIIYTKIHERPGVILRPVMEVCVEEEDGQHLIVFLTHLSAAFNRGRAGGHIRYREVKEILQIMAPAREAGQPHVLMGDFNSLAPGEAFKASALLRYVVQLDQKGVDESLNDGNPHLSSVVPPGLRFLKPVLKVIAKSDLLCHLFDAAAYFYAPRGCIRLLLEAGYLDSYRLKHGQAGGFSCPAAAPAGRIDYIFSCPTLVQRLASCDLITQGEDGLPGSHASDHLPVAAEYGLAVEPVLEQEIIQKTGREAEKVKAESF